MDAVSAATKVWTRETAVGEKRDVWTAMKRGFRCRCPRCGEGKLFRAFLKVDNNCSVCGLDFTPHRADDLPAYLVIVIVGHIMVPAILWIETDYSPPVWLQLAIYLPFMLVGIAGAAAAGERRGGRDAMGVADARIRRERAEPTFRRCRTEIKKRK